VDELPQPFLPSVLKAHPVRAYPVDRLRDLEPGLPAISLPARGAVADCRPHGHIGPDALKVISIANLAQLGHDKFPIAGVVHAADAEPMGTTRGRDHELAALSPGINGAGFGVRFPIPIYIDGAIVDDDIQASTMQAVNGLAEHIAAYKLGVHLADRRGIVA
jgi:hypothetical protein